MLHPTDVEMHLERRKRRREGTAGEQQCLPRVLGGIWVYAEAAKEQADVWQCFPPPPSCWAGAETPWKGRQRVSKALIVSWSWSYVVQHPWAEMADTWSRKWGNSCCSA